MIDLSRENLLRESYERMERELELIGVTAIEDKLQVFYSFPLVNQYLFYRNLHSFHSGWSTRDDRTSSKGRNSCMGADWR